MRKLVLFIMCAIVNMASAQQLDNFNVLNKRIEVTTSEKGREFIKRQEGCTLTPFRYSKYTYVGYGHQFKDSEKVRKITLEEAEEFFRNDISACEWYVSFLLSTVPYQYEFSQGFKDALVSLVFNCGQNRVYRSTFYQKLKKCRVKDGVMNQGDFLCATGEVMNIKEVQIDKHRRKQEIEMMRTR